MIKTTISREGVLAEGRRAAQMASRGTSVIDLCPYDFDDLRRHVWWKGFNEERDAIKKAMEEEP